MFEHSISNPADSIESRHAGQRQPPRTRNTGSGSMTDTQARRPYRVVRPLRRAGRPPAKRGCCLPRQRQIRFVQPRFVVPVVEYRRSPRRRLLRHSRLAAIRRTFASAGKRVTCGGKCRAPAREWEAERRGRSELFVREGRAHPAPKGSTIRTPVPVLCFTYHDRSVHSERCDPRTRRPFDPTSPRVPPRMSDFVFEFAPLDSTGRRQRTDRDRSRSLTRESPGPDLASGPKCVTRTPDPQEGELQSVREASTPPRRSRTMSPR